MPPKTAQNCTPTPLALSNAPRTLLRLPSVTAASGDKKSTFYLKISRGLWTKPVRLDARAVGWPADEVATLIDARIAGKSDEEIRELVKLLESARKAETPAQELGDPGPLAA